MNMQTLRSMVSRTAFVVAFGLLALAVIERLVLQFGYTILRGAYAPGRLVEFAGVLLLLVITLLLRDVRDSVRAGRG